MIVVTVGTHHQPFDRLVRGASVLAEAGWPVRVQCGPSTVTVPQAECVPYLGRAALRDWVVEATVLVTHAGPASVFMAWEAGIPCVVVPRDPARGEHVDDHQLRFARRLVDRCEVVEQVSKLGDAVERARLCVGPRVDAAGRSAAFCARFARVVDGLFDEVAPRAARRR